MSDVYLILETIICCWCCCCCRSSNLLKVFAFFVDWTEVVLVTKFELSVYFPLLEPVRDLTFFSVLPLAVSERTNLLFFSFVLRLDLVLIPSIAEC